jgi:putative NADPH-quinone reductase
MTHYNYYEQMQELSYRATMALAVIGNEGLRDFYSAAEEGFYKKLETVSVEEAKQNINQSQIDQYLITKDFVEEKEREAAELVRAEAEEAHG